MTTPGKMPSAEKQRRAQEIYDSQIRHLIGPADLEKFVKIDVLTGDYEIAANSATAGRLLRARRPGGGYPYYPGPPKLYCSPTLPAHRAPAGGATVMHRGIVNDALESA